jgi:dihydrofolate reductase
MRKVIYTTSISLDGYIEAATGDQSWAFPDEELHRHFNDSEQEIDTHLYGRRMYELMAAYWPSADHNPSAPPYEIDYAHIWKTVPKSSLLQELGRSGLELPPREGRRKGRSCQAQGAAR